MSKDLNASCFKCPSLLTPSQAIIFFGKGIGEVPVCARYGKPVGQAKHSKEEWERVAKYNAQHCPSYGETRPSTPDWTQVNFLVSLPKVESLTKDLDTEAPELVTSCFGCSKRVEQSAVIAETQWVSSLCSAKGRLIPDNRATYEARNCEYRSLGQPLPNLTGIHLLPEYADDFRGSDDPVSLYQKAQTTFVDPVDYPTDKPVSEDDTKHGIRAWRKVTDYSSDRSVYLPIYRLDFFPEEDRALIPRTGDDEHPEDYADHFNFIYKVAVLWTALDETPALWGQSGTGKTELFRHMAWLMCLPFERFSIKASTELDELEGKMEYDPHKGTYFRPGRFVQAWQKPCVAVVDEPNAGLPEVWHFFRAPLDNSKQLILDSWDGRALDRHPDFYPGFAMNPAWDSRNLGVNPIADADANRLMHIHVPLPDPVIEKEIIRKKCVRDGWDIPEDMLTTVMHIAKDIRGMTDALSITWAIRPQNKVARLLRWFDWTTAYRMATADFLETEKQNLILDVVRTHTSNVGFD